MDSKYNGIIEKWGLEEADSIKQEPLTATICSEYQERLVKMKSCGKCTATNYKKLGRELRNRCGLSDKTALDILNNGNVLDILRNYEEEN